MRSLFIFPVADCSIVVGLVDIISAIEFEKSGEYLATGDRGGRLVIFERTDGKEVSFVKLLLDFF